VGIYLVTISILQGLYYAAPLYFHDKEDLWTIVFDSRIGLFAMEHSIRGFELTHPSRKGTRTIDWPYYIYLNLNYTSQNEKSRQLQRQQSLYYQRQNHQTGKENTGKALADCRRYSRFTFTKCC